MADLFYISSWGGSATRWLAGVLDGMPDVRCHHGTRAAQTLPPVGFPSPGDQSPDAFAETMRTRAEETGVSEGAVHGFHGTAMLAPIQERGGRFAGVVRRPVDRIRSLFLLYRDNPRVHEGGIEATYGERLAALSEAHGFEPTRDRLVLLWVVMGTFGYDLELFQSGEPVFRMEEITTDADALSRLLGHVVPSHAAHIPDAASLAVNTGRRNARSVLDDFRYNDVDRVIFKAVAAEFQQRFGLGDRYAEIGYGKND